MVPVEEKCAISKIIESNTKSSAFSKFLNNEAIEDNIENISPKEYVKILKAISANNSNDFNKHFEEYTKRSLDKESPFIYDNYLIFALIVGALRFNIKNDWLQKLLALREQNLNEPERSITVSFKNLINSNILTQDGFQSIILSGLVLINKASINATLIKNVIMSNSNLIRVATKDAFLGSILLFSERHIAILASSEENVQLKEFEERFLKRVSILQNAIYSLVVGVLILLWFLIVKNEPQVEKYANTLNAFLGLFGFAFVWFNKAIRKSIGALLFFLLGYKNKK